MDQPSHARTLEPGLMKRITTMKRQNPFFAYWLLLACFGTATQALELKELEAKLNEAVVFEYGNSDQPLKWIEAAVVSVVKQPEERKQVEATILKSLAESKSVAARSFFCRMLQRIGTDASVPAMAKLLADDDLSHPARLVLDGLGSPAALQALTAALDNASQPLATGIVNTLADHKYRAASEAIQFQLRRKPTVDHHDLSMACVRALGFFGDSEALAELEFGEPRLQTALQHARIRAAEFQLQGGKPGAGKKLIGSMLATSAPADSRMAGLQLASKLPAIDRDNLLLATLKDADARLRASAVQLLGTSNSPKTTTALIRQIEAAQPETRPLLLRALAGKDDPAVSVAFRTWSEAGETPDEAVRVAAIRGMGTLKDPALVPELIRLAAEADGEAQKVARFSLRHKPGAADVKLLDGLAEHPAQQVEWIDALADRGETGAGNSLVQWAETDNASVRQAAIRGLGKLLAGDQLTPLLKLLRQPREISDLPHVERGLAEAIYRAGNPEQSAAALLQLSDLPAEAQPSRARLLGRCPTASALEEVQRLLGADDKKLSDAAARTLAEWNDPAACDALLELAGQTDNAAHKLFALRGCMRLAQDLPNFQARGLKALKLASTTGERREVLGALSRKGKSTGVMVAVEPLLNDSEVGEEAALAAVEIARRIKNKDLEVMRRVMGKVKESSKIKRTRQRAEEVIKSLPKS